MSQTMLAMADFHAHLAAGGRAKVGIRLAPSNNVQETKGSERTATFIFSDDSIDSYGDTIDARGWDLKSFEANPVALFGHDPSKPEYVIGRARNVRTEGRALVGEIEFAEASVNPTADTVFQMVKAGYLNAVSVGFMPVEWAFSKDKSRPGGIDFKKQKLLEISVVAIPANENALVQARAAGIDVDRLALGRAKTGPKLTKRGLYEVSLLACILADLDFLEDMAEWEAEYEGDGSAVPQMLTDALNQLGAALIAMTAEEVGELLADETEPETVEPDMPMSMSNAGMRCAAFAMMRGVDFGKWAQKLLCGSGKAVIPQAHLDAIKALPEEFRATAKKLPNGAGSARGQILRCANIAERIIKGEQAEHLVEVEPAAPVELELPAAEDPALPETEESKSTPRLDMARRRLALMSA